MEAKKIVLSTTPTEGEFINWTTPKHFAPKAMRYMPLGILSLASNLPKHHEVVILDPSSEGWTIEETIERIESESPDVLGLSVPTRRIYAMGEILRRTSAPYKAVGGPHATYYANQILKAGADVVFSGALADLEFREAVESQPKGVVHCKTAINEIDFPKRDLLNVEEYFPKVSVLFKANNRLPMFSSVGCPNKCMFCNVQSKQLQLKVAETIVDEMQYLQSIGCRSVHVLDDNFNVIRKHVEGILDEMEKRNFRIEWSGRGQTRMDLNLIDRMKQTGFKRIHVGFEALDDEILRYFMKSQRLKDIETFCEVMRRENIQMLGYFISGSPKETDSYRTKLPQMIRDLGINFPFFNILFPEPDTPYYASLLKEGIYKNDHWAEYMKNPTPNYEIPYPYGKTMKNEVVAYNQSLIEEFKIPA